MRVLVTGPDGILGNNLVRILLKNEYDVSVFMEEGRQPGFLNGLPIEFIYGNILNPRQVREACLGCDIVIHAAAKTDTWPARHPGYYTVNVTGTQNVIEAVKSSGVKRLIHVGTANSFGPGSKETPGDETNPYDGAKYRLDYMSSKREAQEKVLSAVKEEGVDAVVVNPTFMIGPFDTKPSSGTMILAIYRGKVPGYPGGGRNFVYVKDVATAIVNAITIGKKGECYIAGNENLSYGEAFSKMAGACGVTPPGRKLPVSVTLFYGRLMGFLGSLFGFKPSVNYAMSKISVEDHYYTSRKAVEKLNMPQTPLSEALEEAVKWFGENGYMD